jgi:hypothetical protein
VSARHARPGGAGALGAALTEQERAIGRLTVEKATLEREVERLRAIEASATTLRARVRAWATVPFRGPGYEEEYDLANNVAEDAIMEAADDYDAALAEIDSRVIMPS